jgi:DNA-binding response OmpR family regulator
MSAMASADAQTVLVVEDEASIASFVAMYLRNAGYDVKVAPTGRDALTLADSQSPALIVLDLMLPDIDGIEVCRRLRQHSDVPILMLTARDEDVDKIVGLEVGADDYLTKPFNPRELVARVKSILRRSTPERKQAKTTQIRHGQLLERVWGYTFAGDTRTVDVHIRQLRRKLGDASPIVTVWGVGYKAAPAKDASKDTVTA